MDSMPKHKQYCFIILNLKKMKKVFFSLAVLATVALASCGGNKAAEATDSDSVVAVDSCCGDSCSADSAVADSAVAVDSVK